LNGRAFSKNAEHVTGKVGHKITLLWKKSGYTLLEELRQPYAA
jgi:hypothetical protein